MQTTIIESLKQTAANLATPNKGPRPRGFSVMNGPAAGPYYTPPAEDIFAAKLKHAVRAVRARSDREAGQAGRAPASYAPTEEGFAGRLRKAIKTLVPTGSMSQKEHEEFVERERARYRPFLQRREHCRGE